MVSRTGGQADHSLNVDVTRAGTQKREARRAEVEERLTFRGGIAGGPEAERPRNRGTAPADGTNQPLKSGTRGTIVNITA